MKIRISTSTHNTFSAKTLSSEAVILVIGTLSVSVVNIICTHIHTHIRTRVHTCIYTTTLNGVQTKFTVFYLSSRQKYMF